jgi:polyhydroxybutyrate depolymerase
MTELGVIRRVLLGALLSGVLLGGCSESDDGTAVDADTEDSPAPDIESTTATSDSPSDSTSDSQAPSDGEGADASVACDKGRPTDVPDNRTVARTVTSVGGEREYLAYVPESYTGDELAPLVFTFHGAGSNKEQQIIYSNFGPGADERGAIVVAPQALNQPTWWSPFGFRGAVDDLTFFDDLLAAVSDEFCVDRERVFVSGMSSGGFMSSAVGCARSDKVAAVAPVTATFYTPEACGEAGPTPYVYFHGTDDPVVPYYGNGEPDAPPGPGSAQYNVQLWADHNNCEPEPETTDLSAEVTRFTWSGCDAPTSFYRINGGGHTWPGGVDVPRLGYTTHEIAATDVIWDVFDQAASN